MPTPVTTLRSFVQPAGWEFLYAQAGERSPSGELLYTVEHYETSSGDIMSVRQYPDGSYQVQVTKLSPIVIAGLVALGALGLWFIAR